MATIYTICPASLWQAAVAAHVFHGSPLDLQDGFIEFKVSTSIPGDTTVIGWASMLGELKPDWMSSETWEAVYANLQAQVGSTWACIMSGTYTSTD